MLYLWRRSMRDFTTISVNSHECTMTKKLFSAAVFFCFFSSIASAQSASAPGVRIADAAQPTALLMEAAMKCAESKDKDTRKFCLELVKLEVKRGTKVANAAADAAQAARPVVIAPPYGYGGYYGGRGYYSTPYYRQLGRGCRRLYCR